MTTQINNKKKKNGRPPVWTEDKIEGLSDRLLDWAEEPTAFALIQFCRRERLCASRLPDLARKDEKFYEALMYAKTIIADRIIESINSKGGNVHPVFFNKYIRANDFLLDQHLKEIDKTQLDEMVKRDVKIIDFSKYKKDQDGKE